MPLTYLGHGCWHGLGQRCGICEHLLPTHNLSQALIAGLPAKLNSAQLCSKPVVSACERVSMGSTVSRKTAKHLAVRHKNERILTHLSWVGGRGQWAVTGALQTVGSAISRPF